MLQTRTINPADGIYPASSDYVHAIEVSGATRMLFVAGTMGLDGLPEPLVLYANPGSVLQDENIKFAQQFDRSIVTIPRW